MKSVFKSIIIVSAVMTAACTKVLDKRDLTGLQDDLVFNDSILARTFVDYIYDQNLPGWGGTNGTSANLTDESYGDTKFLEGSLTINDVADIGTAVNANSNYGKIRMINKYLDEIDGGAISESWKKTLKGQALFFRAWRYFELVKLYGGVPLVLHELPAVGQENKDAALVPRSKTSECIAQIVADLDAATQMLPGKWADADWGRITSGTAAALKGRVLQYWASPQFNPGDLTDRWQAAYDAAKNAKTILALNGYGLNSNFETMWFSEKGNPEAVFITGYNDLTADQSRKNNSYDNSTRPAFAGTGGGSNQPVKELVDAFPMKDGKAPGTSTTYVYNPQLFYKNRDPRFDKTIAYNGASWQLNGTSYPRIWFYFSTGTTFAPFTVNTTATAATNTGFFTRKAINPTTIAGNVQYSGTDWMEIRYAEVLLNLAEAATGVNKLDEAYTELIAIRKRAGIDAGTDNLYGLKAGMTRAEMFKAILDERRYEFAFEGKRYFDMRRWKLFESTLNGKRRTGVTYLFKPSATIANHAAFLTQRDAMPLDDVYTNNMTLGTKQMDTRYNINWKPEYYFFAIPQSALDNNINLKQTNGWTGGSFDPLQ